jgi:hypothetical protein
VIVAVVPLPEGMRWPQAVQKLAASSTLLPHDVQSAIHFAPGIFCVAW